MICAGCHGAYDPEEFKACPVCGCKEELFIVKKRRGRPKKIFSK